MTDQLLTEDEKTELAVWSIIFGVIVGANAALVVFGVSLIFLHVGQSFGVAIVSFWPIGWIAARWNVSLFIVKKKSELDKEVTT